MDLTDLYDDLKTESVSDQVSFCKQLDNLIEEKKVEYQLEKKVAFVSSSTMNGIKESLRTQTSKHNIFLEVYLSEYNQFAQEILDDKSDLYRFKPEVVFLHLDTRTLAGEIFFSPNNPDQNISKWKTDTISLVQTLITKLVDADIKVIFSLLEVPDIAPLGVLESSTYGLNRAIYGINLSLMELSDDIENLFLFDYDKFLGKIGKQQTFDEKLYYLADIRLKPNLLSSLSSELAIFLKALYVTPKKCLVLDLDNTLWGGVIGEAGMDGINLGPDPMGRSFMEFQQYILSLHNRGVILALNSKNNSDDALNVIRNHPHMVLKEENFAVMKINWEDKVKNLKSLALEINIGLDRIEKRISYYIISYN